MMARIRVQRGVVRVQARLIIARAMRGRGREESAPMVAVRGARGFAPPRGRRELAAAGLATAPLW
jgi:hypothetical protein